MNKKTSWGYNEGLFLLTSYVALDYDLSLHVLTQKFINCYILVQSKKQIGW